MSLSLSRINKFPLLPGSSGQWELEVTTGQVGVVGPLGGEIS